MTKLRFWRDRETRNTVVYQEERQRGTEPVIGTLYVRKKWLEANGDPELLVMTLDARGTDPLPADGPPAV